VKTARVQATGSIKTSVSCARPVFEFAKEEATRQSFNSFSGYVEFLIRLQQPGIRR
jgi:hypothetical protein